MIFKISLLFLLLLSPSQFKAQACAPFTTNQIIVGKYNGLIANTVPDRKGSFQFIDFTDKHKPFAGKYNELGKFHFIDTNRINLSNYQKGDFIITISDYDDGSYSDYFTIYEIGKISCNNDNEIFIEKREGIIKEFGKKIWTCGKAPDYILSEKEVLKKINEKYNICNSINSNENTLNKVVNEKQIINTIESKQNNESEKEADELNNLFTIIDNKDLLNKEIILNYLWILILVLSLIGIVYLYKNRLRKKYHIK